MKVVLVKMSELKIGLTSTQKRRISHQNRQHALDHRWSNEKRTLYGVYTFLEISRLQNVLPKVKVVPKQSRIAFEPHQRPSVPVITFATRIIE
jgi:hypothetical protein